ncbi:hypothetical protein IQ06DRAFT_347869 [Phaeosphaeriaceae sp. SRC1lsM3a]|nr:hypothetical protein IQ06DRAFT_347869 [Stagonospora sp. SRC1lsM3a]
MPLVATVLAFAALVSVAIANGGKKPCDDNCGWIGAKRCAPQGHNKALEQLEECPNNCCETVETCNGVCVNEPTPHCEG